MPKNKEPYHTISNLGEAIRIHFWKGNDLSEHHKRFHLCFDSVESCQEAIKFIKDLKLDKMWKNGKRVGRRNAKSPDKV